MLEFEWDSEKASANLAKHDISFELAADFLSTGNYVEILSSRGNEARIMAVGVYAERVITVVFTRRNGTIRIISARSASREERRKYRSL